MCDYDCIDDLPSPRNPEPGGWWYAMMFALALLFGAWLGYRAIYTSKTRAAIYRVAQEQGHAAGVSDIKEMIQGYQTVYTAPVTILAERGACVSDFAVLVAYPVTVGVDISDAEEMLISDVHLLMYDAAEDNVGVRIRGVGNPARQGDRKG